MIDVSFLPKGGIMEKWLQYCEPFQWPWSFCAFSMLGAASAAINDRIIVNVGYEPETHTNLYIILYGESGTRKSRSMKHAMYVLGDALPHDVDLLPAKFTGERMATILANQSVKLGKCGGLVFNDEFSTIVGGPEYCEGNLQFLSQIWDCPPVYEVGTQAREEERILNPYLVILSASNPDWFDKVDPKRLSGGALRRLLIVHEYTKREPPAHLTDKNRRRMDVYREVVVLFRERFSAKAFGPGNHMALTNEAREKLEEWDNGPRALLHAEVGAREGHFVSCMSEHALRLGSVWHILEGGNPCLLPWSSLEIGIKLAECLTPTLFQAYQALVPTPYAKLRAALVREAARSMPVGLTDSSLDTKMVESLGVPREQVVAARAGLISERKLVRLTGGRLGVP